MLAQVDFDHLILHGQIQNSDISSALTLIVLCAVGHVSV